MRYTTFRFALAPTPLQAAMLARHAGASRFAYNQCLRLDLDALEAQRVEPMVFILQVLLEVREGQPTPELG
jgi:putative transposase